jgi:hypothetical protein
VTCAWHTQIVHACRWHTQIAHAHTDRTHRSNTQMAHKHYISHTQIAHTRSHAQITRMGRTYMQMAHAHRSEHRPHTHTNRTHRSQTQMADTLIAHTHTYRTHRSHAQMKRTSRAAREHQNLLSIKLHLQRVQSIQWRHQWRVQSNCERTGGRHRKHKQN